MKRYIDWMTAYKAICVLCVLIWLAGVIAVVWVAIHFIAKYW